LTWQRENPDRINTQEGLIREYWIQFAILCREEGSIRSWKGPIEPLDLEIYLESPTEHLFGEKDRIRGTILYLKQFSGGQRRILKHILEEMTKVWLRHLRRTFAIDRMNRRLFPNIWSTQDY